MQLDADESSKLPSSLLGKRYGCVYVNQIESWVAKLSLCWPALNSWAKNKYFQNKFPKSFDLYMSSILSLEFKDIMTSYTEISTS